MWPNPQDTADLVTFTEEILNGKLHFCAVSGNMCITIVCYPVCQVIKLIYLSILIKSFSYMTKNSEQELNYL